MIFSPTRFEDMKFRAKLLEDIEFFVKGNYAELARSAGELSVLIKKRIDTHDYSKEDAWREREAKVTH